MGWEGGEAGSVSEKGRGGRGLLLWLLGDNTLFPRTRPRCLRARDAPIGAARAATGRRGGETCTPREGPPPPGPRAPLSLEGSTHCERCLPVTVVAHRLCETRGAGAGAQRAAQRGGEGEAAGASIGGRRGGCGGPRTHVGAHAPQRPGKHAAHASRAPRAVPAAGPAATGRASEAPPPPRSRGFGGRSGGGVRPPPPLPPLPPASPSLAGAGGDVCACVYSTYPHGG